MLTAICSITLFIHLHSLTKALSICFLAMNAIFFALFVQETVSFAPSWFSPFSRNNPGVKIYQILNLSREVKPIAFFICEQQFTDIYAKLRRRMNFFFKIKRYVTSEGVSLQPLLKVYMRDDTIYEKIVFIEPVIFVNGRRVRNPVFVIPKLSERELEKFRTLDKKFKEEYIMSLISPKQQYQRKEKKLELLGV
jgi:hypothetical protein